MNGLEKAKPVPQLKIDDARRALAECVTLDVAKDIRDKAEAVRAYLRQQGAGREAQNDAAEIKLRAERRLGELLAEMYDTGSRRTRDDGASKALHDATPSLADLGIERTAASRWQQVAAIPAMTFEAYLQEERARGGEITTKATLRLARRPPTEDDSDLEAEIASSPRLERAKLEVGFVMKILEEARKRWAPFDEEFSDELKTCGATSVLSLLEQVRREVQKARGLWEGHGGPA